VGKDILEFSVAKVKDLLEQGDLVKGKLMLRFLAGLARIMDEDGIMTIIGEIVSKIEGQEANVFPVLKGSKCRQGQIIFRKSCY
jgi:hypothetical protein